MRLDGSTYCRCIGRTVWLYCAITWDTLRPRSAQSRSMRRISRMSASASCSTAQSCKRHASILESAIQHGTVHGANRTRRTTKTFRSNSSTSSGWHRIKIPSIRRMGRGPCNSTDREAGIRVCVEKSYAGTSTIFPALRSRMCCTKSSVSRAFGWSKLVCVLSSNGLCDWSL
jgi:hypothetical protein